jgi:hypothetical protein
MIQQCATLREIDALIQRASCGMYSIEDVSIVDVRILPSKKRREQFELTGNTLESAYNVFREVMELKKPDVVLGLQCQTGTAENEFARKICSQARPKLGFKSIKIKDPNALLVLGFHLNLYLHSNKSPTETSKLRQNLHTTLKFAFEASKEAAACISNTAERHSLVPQTLPTSPTRACLRLHNLHLRRAFDLAVSQQTSLTRLA